MLEDYVSNMVRNGVVMRRRRQEGYDGFDLSQRDRAQQAHVLAVDDSLVDRKVIERLLTISCFKVTAVDSGRRALQFLGLDEEKSTAVDGLKVDLIITDYCMPGMTGYELLKKIKESSAFREVPVVIMSSENVLARIDRCLEEGAEDFIVKPVKLSDVKRLKDYMTRDEKSINKDRCLNKRKLRDPSTSPPSSPSPVSKSTSLPSSQSPVPKSTSQPSSPPSKSSSPQLSESPPSTTSPSSSSASTPQVMIPRPPVLNSSALLRSCEPLE